jgi:hypothetical protein
VSTASPCPATATRRTSSSPSAWWPAPSWCTARCRDTDPRRRRRRGG